MRLAGPGRTCRRAAARAAGRRHDTGRPRTGEAAERRVRSSAYREAATPHRTWRGARDVQPDARGTLPRKRGRGRGGGWLRAGTPMSPSRLFILRPVATSLLMAAIMLVGIVAYRFLPLSALPEVDYPTIQVVTLYPGASPDVMTSSVTSPLEVQLGQMPGLNQMSSVSSAGSSVITLQFSLALEPRCRRAGGPGSDQRGRQSVALGPAGAADLRQGQPGGRADPDPRPDLEDAAADPGRRPRRHAPRAEDLAADRGRPRQHQRRASPGGAHPGQSAPARRLRPQHRRSAHDDQQRQRQHAQGQFRRADAGNTRSMPTTS